MTALRFEGTRASRPDLAAAAFAVLLLGALTCALLIALLEDGAEAYVPWVGIPAMAVFVGLIIASMVPRPATLSVDDGAVRVSWRERPILRSGLQIAIGRQVSAGLDTPVGLVAHLHGDGGKLRIGGHGHPGAGLRVDGASARTVDFQLTAADFDRFVGALQAARGRADEELVIGLLRSPQSAAGMWIMMAPMLVTLMLAAAFDVTLSASGLGDLLQRTQAGRVAMTATIIVILAAGLLVTVMIGLRVRRPALSLRISAAGIVLARTAGGEVARAPWSQVWAEASDHQVIGRYLSGIYPALELRIGDSPSLALSAWDASQAWPMRVPRRPRAPPYVVGAPQWSQLVAALREHRRL